MSVGKNSFGLAPYYNWKSYNVSSTGLDADTVVAAAASPTFAVAFGRIVASGTTTFKAFKSSNAIDWSEITSAPNTAITGVAYANNTFVAVGFSGVIYTAPGTNPDTWTARTKAGASSFAFFNVKVSNGKFFAMQEYNNIQSSTDGITWSLSATGGTFTYTSHVNSDNYFDGPHQYSVSYEDGMYIHLSHETTSTASARILIQSATATSTTDHYDWSTTGFQGFTRDDIGDGLGPLTQAHFGGNIAVVALENHIARGLPRHVNGRVFTSTMTSFFNSSSVNKMPIPSTSKNISGSIVTTDFLFNMPIYYTEGWYNIIYPGVAAKEPSGSTSYSEAFGGTQYTQAVYGAMSLNWNERDFGQQHKVEYPSSNVQARLIYPIASMTLGNITALMRRWIPFTFKGSEFIISGTGTLGDNYGSIKVLKSSRAFKRPKTTINYTGVE
jgi:hypothetical protein